MDAIFALRVFSHCQYFPTIRGVVSWTQFSLFECFLSKKELVLLKSKLAKHIENTQDSVRFYPLCANCLEKVETVGGGPPTEDAIFIV